MIYEWGWLHESGNWVKSRTFDPAPCPTCGGDGTAPEGAQRGFARQPPDFRMFQTRWP